MTGHEPLIRMRIQRYKPLHVTLNDRPWAFDWWRCEHLMPYPDIGIDPEEAIERLDLRFVVGLPVMVEQRDPDRLRRLMLACEKAGAKRVYGFAPGVAVCSEGEDQTWRKC